jgi:hypothetical protein
MRRRLHERRRRGRSRWKKGVGGHELDEGDEEGKGPGLTDTGEDVEADLGVVDAEVMV